MANDFKIKNGLQLGGALTENVGTISGNADLDLSTGNVFSYTPTADVTFAFSNAGETEHSFVLSVTGSNVSTSYDLANASYDSVSFSVAAQETAPEGLFFKPDGTKMYICGGNANRVSQYSLSTPFDISTASYDSVFLSTAFQGPPSSLTFGDDGAKLFTISGAFGVVFQYNLSTPYDLSSGSYSNSSVSISSQEAGATGLAFNSSGTKMYVCGSASDSVYQYSLSSAFSISTASYDGISFDVSPQEASAEDVTFNSDGSKMYILGSGNDTVYQYSLSTAFDLSTASYDSISFSVLSQDGFPRGMSFSSDGSKLYMVGINTDTVYQYSTAGTPAPATFTYPASVAWPSGTAPDAPAVGETDILEFSTTDGGTTWYGVRSGDALA